MIDLQIAGSVIRQIDADGVYTVVLDIDQRVVTEAGEIRSVPIAL